MSKPPPPDSEWLEPDGLGGFASGTVGGLRTRRYHALLLSALVPPSQRVVLVNGFEAWVTTPAGRFPITKQRYTPDVTHPGAAATLVSFSREPWPRWTFQLPDGTGVVQEVFVPHEEAIVLVSWRLLEPRDGVTLEVRPLLSGRDYHSLHHENPAFQFHAQPIRDGVSWNPYPGIPAIHAQANAEYRHHPLWYRGFQYDEERARGLDFIEDLASPGVFIWDLSREEAVWRLGAGAVQEVDRGSTLLGHLRRQRRAESARRRAFPSPLHRAADAYLVRRSTTTIECTADGESASRTLLAGYPWFTDWGRDTFIALRGLCLATGRHAEALNILLTWARAVSGGMIPNRFPDGAAAPEFNSVDASLWFVVTAHELITLAGARRFPIGEEDLESLHHAILTILDAFSSGTRHGIREDSDGLLACGEPGVQLTWMDARVGDWVVTPRIGKPVEVQALWINALWIGSLLDARWRPTLHRAQASFRHRFWNEARRCLFDVVDADHIAGRNDATLRPNQIFAVGGLPLALIEGDRARLVVECVEKELLTPVGVRTLAPAEPGYTPRYCGGVRERDGAYHQGTVWPWLLGPFTEAWLRVHGQTAAHQRLARQRFLAPLMQHLHEAGLGHVSEVADAEAPHTPRGCPWQAWSLGELLRLDLQVLHAPARPPRALVPSSRPELSIALA